MTNLNRFPLNSLLNRNRHLVSQRLANSNYQRLLTRHNSSNLRLKSHSRLPTNVKHLLSQKPIKNNHIRQLRHRLNGKHNHLMFNILMRQNTNTKQNYGPTLLTNSRINVILTNHPNSRNLHNLKHINQNKGNGIPQPRPITIIIRTLPIKRLNGTRLINRNQFLKINSRAHNGHHISPSPTFTLLRRHRILIRTIQQHTKQPHLNRSNSMINHHNLPFITNRRQLPILIRPNHTVTINRHQRRHRILTPTNLTTRTSTMSLIILINRLTNNVRRLNPNQNLQSNSTNLLNRINTVRRRHKFTMRKHNVRLTILQRHTTRHKRRILNVMFNKRLIRQRRPTLFNPSQRLMITSHRRIMLPTLNNSINNSTLTRSILLRHSPFRHSIKILNHRVLNRLLRTSRITIIRNNSNRHLNHNKRHRHNRHTNPRRTTRRNNRRIFPPPEISFTVAINGYSSLLRNYRASSHQISNNVAQSGHGRSRRTQTT